MDDCREHCFSCGILGYFKEQRRESADDAWCCPPLGRDKARQPVDIVPVPLYFNEEMNQGGVQLPAGSGVDDAMRLQLADAKGQFDDRVPQRRHGTVSQRVAVADDR